MSDNERPTASTNGNTDITTRNGPNDVATKYSSRMRRLDPFSMLNDLELMMDRTLGRRWPLLRGIPGFTGAESGWIPQIDMYEQGNQIVIKAELPGISKDDIDVSLDHGDLVIRGERKSEHEVEEENIYRMERSFGSFSRRLPVPKGVKDDQISASFDNGVLTIRMPNPEAETTTPKKIAIQ